ncbi:MAG: BamA/TamA family outer membrane protein [Bacteroidales bacterium]
MRKLLKIISSSFYLAILLFLSGCSNLRYLDEGQKLYTGSEIVIESEEKIKEKEDIENELQNILRPKPNEKFLYWRYRLWFYNITGDPPKWALSKWLKNTIGRPPVLYQDFDKENSIQLIENRLFNMGFFDATVDFESLEKEKKAKAKFGVNLKPAYQIRNINVVDNDNSLLELISKSMENSLLQNGEQYKLQTLKDERERISKVVRDEGYFFFHPDFLLFRADTNSRIRVVDIRLVLKPNMPPKANQKYKINNIYIDTDQIIRSETQSSEIDTTITDEGLIRLGEGIIKPTPLERAIFFEKDKIYNTRDHDLTLNHLTGLGVYKFVNIRFSENENQDENNLLDVSIRLTPIEKKTFSMEVSGVSKSNNFAGPGLNASFNNKNFLGGAENFSLSLTGAYEFLPGNPGVTSAEAGIDSELTIPRFVAPFIPASVSTQYIPRTHIGFSLNYLSRTDAFSLSSANARFGYNWNLNRLTRHRLTPFTFSIFSLGNVSAEYDQIFNNQQLLRRGLFEQFIFGSEYSFFYNSQVLQHKKHNFYFNYNIDLSGNLLYGISETFSLPKTDDNDYAFAGNKFAQYSKTDFDFRHYLDMGHGQKLVSRIIAGIAIPYGNSASLPYVKLFTIGGSNSIRAFQPRGLGPGTYESPDSLQSTFDIYRAGEIKLEMNMEYRYEFNNILKGALFVDAGNIWNIRENENSPGGKWDGNDFYNQIALGTGAGLRFDFTFFILRLDLAFPLAIPYSDSDSFLESPRFSDSKWRNQNLILNLAIGYPF